MSEPLYIIPLGGVEEVGGLNMTVLQYGDDLIVVDAGLMFPEDEMLGIDFVIPDLTYLIENREKVRAVLITHGHEDHTGALPFLIRELGGSVPVYGTPLTLGLLKEKLSEHKVSTPLHTVKPRDTVKLGVFTVEFIRVTHSIVDGVGLGIHTPYGLIVHTGDFKIDPTPVDGELLDFYKFSEFGDSGTLLLMSDSTNAEKGGFTYSEKEVRRAFEDIFSAAPGRLIIATFASNIHRIQQVIDVAVKHGRKIAICGKSMVSNAQIALDLGYLTLPAKTWLNLDEIRKLPDREVAVITTGSQGEPMSVLSRIATGEHKTIKIKPDDTVVLSAKVIPGNERSIGKIINHLFRRGANVIYEKVSEVHVSGHASKEELKLMLNLVRPRYFMPVHGEYRHLIYHSKLAEKLNIPTENIFIMQDGNVLEINSEGVRKNGKVHSGRIFIDGKGDIKDIVLRDRWRLAHDGIVLVIISMEKPSGHITSGPDIISRGFVFEEASTDVISEARRVVAETITGLDPEVLQDLTLLKARIRNTLKKHIYKTMNRRPMIVPIIFEV
ncbi:Ribonuclease J (endonuclease and 5' exonuclease) [hydrothermal vent metagenome]|uniref:Ribonuclease J (Endonuclease and 5' exonuclease) n=1 Tax=hydrothermal vent metagenome TaxID=652676 RepID=A0A3B1D4E3_9ZZZZ